MDPSVTDKLPSLKKNAVRLKLVVNAPRRPGPEGRARPDDGVILEIPDGSYVHAVRHNVLRGWGTVEPAARRDLDTWVVGLGREPRTAPFQRAFVVEVLHEVMGAGRHAGRLLPTYFPASGYALFQTSARRWSLSSLSELVALESTSDADPQELQAARGRPIIVWRGRSYTSLSYNVLSSARPAGISAVRLPVYPTPEAAMDKALDILRMWDAAERLAGRAAMSRT